MVATVKRLRIAAATVEYFEADGYYAPGDPEHRKASRWYGEGAKHCGLYNRTVTARAFASVLEGHVPRTDVRLGRLRDGEHQHLPGIDITFSAPKSFSLEASLYAAPHTRARLRNAHDAAVRAALDLLERELLQTRGYDRTTRRRPRIAAHGLLAATFRHATNRNLDPQIHTHCVVANMTRNADGQWRSAEFTAAFRAKKLLGAYYRAELRRRVEAIGYATVPTLVGTVPGFEIAGYPKALLERFSTRRRDLLKWLEDRGLEYTPANAQQAVLATRRRKAEPDRAALAAIWQQRAGGCVGQRDPGAVRRSGAPAPPAPSPLEVTRRAVEHLAERSTLFTAHDLRGYALAYGGGRQTLAEIDAALAQLQRDRLLLEVPADGVDRAFTTRGAAAAERKVLALMQGGIGTGQPLADAGAVADALTAGPLTAGQRAAVETVLLGRDRVVGVQGYAGTGKTTMLREVVRRAAGAPLLGLAPSTAAVRVLAREAELPTRTLQWFLVRHGDIADGTADADRLAAARAVHRGGLLIVDEASMIGTTAMVRLLRIADRIGVARVALVGDRRQLRAIEAGQPFRLLQRAGMPTARMTEVLRQRDPSLRTGRRASDRRASGPRDRGTRQQRPRGRRQRGPGRGDGRDHGRPVAGARRRGPRAHPAAGADPCAARRGPRRDPAAARGRGGAARADAHARSLREPAPHARTEARTRALPGRGRPGVPPARLRGRSRGRGRLPCRRHRRRAGAARHSRRPDPAHAPRRAGPLPLRALRDPPDRAPRRATASAGRARSRATDWSSTTGPGPPSARSTGRTCTSRRTPERSTRWRGASRSCITSTMRIRRRCTGRRG